MEDYKMIKEIKKQNNKTQLNKNKNNNIHGECRSPYSMEIGSATILYIALMLIGAIFIARFEIWVALTFIYISFMRAAKNKKNK